MKLPTRCSSVTSSAASPTKPPPAMSTYWPRLAAVGATLVISGLTMVTASGSGPPASSAEAGKDVAHGDGAAEGARA